MMRWLTALLLLNIPARAAVLEENFLSRARMSGASTAVWNHALGVVHPPIRIVNYKAGYTPISVDVGDGRDGAFEPATYSRFDTDGDPHNNIIALNTDDHPILRVTRFTLAAGQILKPTGSQPLQIYSLSDVTIEGEIHCFGDPGGNGVGATPGAAGASRCGGRPGGSGGLPGAVGADGDSPHADITAGAGGLNPGQVGGGGGSWNTTAVPTAGFGGVGAGTSNSDPEFTKRFGSAGGGGGAGAIGAGGGGGGGGGGAVIIHAARDFNLGRAPNSTLGFIDVRGGAGGNTNTIAGAGGGGGGGSTLVFAGGTINIYNNDAAGAGRADLGLGGANASTENAGDGGSGRNWYASLVYNGIGYYTPSEEAPVNVAPALGVAEFDVAPVLVESTVYDLRSSVARITELTTAPISGDFRFEVAGSDDNFATDDTGFDMDPARTFGKRYVKFRIQISPSSATNPDLLDTATITYDPGQRTDFELRAAGCGRTGHPDSADAPLWLLMMVLLGTAWWRLRQTESTRGAAGD